MFLNRRYSSAGRPPAHPRPALIQPVRQLHTPAAFTRPPARGWAAPLLAGRLADATVLAAGGPADAGQHGHAARAPTPTPTCTAAVAPADTVAARSWRRLAARSWPG